MSAEAQRTSRMIAQPSWSDLFSVPAKGVPVNQTAAEMRAGASSWRRYSARIFVFSSFLVVAPIWAQASANWVKGWPGVGISVEGVFFREASGETPDATRETRALPSE